MSILYKIINWVIFLGYWIFITFIIIKILNKRRTIPYSLSWILIIYFLPLFGIITWVFFGELYSDKKKDKIASIILPQTTNWFNSLKINKSFFNIKNSDVASSVFKLCKNRQCLSGIKCNKLELLTSTKKIIKIIIQDINLAKYNIEMVFYIWKPGGIVDEVAMALIKSSKRGILCRIILDSAGSIEFFKSPWVKIMRNSGIQIVEAMKVNLFRIFLRRVDLRQHRKIILIDNYIAYTGSMNLIDPLFFKQSLGIGQWVDIMARMEGPIAATIGIVYSFDWEIETGKRILPIFNVNYKKNNFKNKNVIQVIASGLGFPENMIHQVLLTVFYSAKKRLIITTPYLVPSDDLLHAICTASHRGVKVTIIIPKNNDSLLVHWASKAFFTELLESGVKIYQFKKGLLHTKSILVDNQLSVIGTVNLDMRSIWLNFEITLIIDDKLFSKNLYCIQKEYINNSILINKKLWNTRSIWKKIIEKIFYFFSPLL
ncbi:Cardiolipin synthase A [Buchnera aphidicola (Neophyllaphis podocarpi)]|uniref:cardiolipin synthase n=1 Tax=Buchnera aphidicola TaxID=9 RepID=UPI00346459A0